MKLTFALSALVALGAYYWVPTLFTSEHQECTPEFEAQRAAARDYSEKVKEFCVQDEECLSFVLQFYQQKMNAQD